MIQKGGIKFATDKNVTKKDYAEIRRHLKNLNPLNSP